MRRREQGAGGRMRDERTAVFRKDTVEQAVVWGKWMVGSEVFI